MRLRHSLALLITLFLGGVSLVSAGSDPTILKTDGIPSNAHVLSLVPTFCWTLPASETTINWQVQVDDDPNFGGANGTGPCSTPFFWDTGQGSKGTNGNARCASRATTPTCYVNADLEYRPTLIYWRVRTDDPNGIWSNWVSDSVKLNFPPLWPVSMSAAVDAVASTDTVQTDPNTVASPGTYYVKYLDPNAVDDSSHGTLANPWSTLQYATSRLVAGDTLKVIDPNVGATDVPYPENVWIRPGTHQSGTAMHPITVQANAGNSPMVVGAPGLQNAIMLQGVHDWVIKGITAAVPVVDPNRSCSTTGLCAAIGLNNVQYVVIDTFSIPDGYFPSWQTNTGGVTRGIDIWNGSRDIRIINSTFNRSISDAIDYEGGGWGNLTIQGNEFTSSGLDPNTPTVGRFLHLHPGAKGNVLIDSNYFHDANPSQAAVFNYKGAFARYTNNVFYNLGGKNGIGTAVMADRSGPIQFINNTCYNVQDNCVWALKGVGYTDFINNIVMHSDPNGIYAGKDNSASNGILLGANDPNPGTTTRGSVIDYNNFRTLKASALGYIIAGGTAQSDLLDHAPTGNVTTDPNFLSVDPNDIATDFLRLDAGSGALDPNDNGLPVPTLGGTFRDMGRFERGETNNSMYKIYTYQPEVAALMDSTPKFSWVLRDEDNLLDTCCDFLPPGDVDIQKKFQLQIDEATTFNTLSPAHPLIDSGIISSLNEFWTLPASRALTATKDYYFRVRQSDEEDPNVLGPWSDSTFAIGMDDDLEPADPVITSQNPDPNEVGVDCAPLLFSFTLHDEGSTMDCDTVTLPNSSMSMVVDGGIDYGGIGWDTTPLGAARATCTYSLSRNLSSGNHTFRFQVCDQVGSPNCVDTGTYTFTCASPNAPAPTVGARIYQVP